MKFLESTTQSYDHCRQIFLIKIWKGFVVFAVHCHYFLNVFDGNLMALVPVWHLARKSCQALL
jgi:hypothetical protein